MAPPRKYTYPPDDELIALIEEHGQVGTAEILDIPPNALAQYKANRGIKAKKKPRPRQNNALTPVDDPDRIRLQRVQDENKLLKKENRQYAEKLASQRDFFEQIVEATRVSVDVPKLKTKSQGKSKPANSIITPIYDQQYGSFVRPGDVPGARSSMSVWPAGSRRCVRSPPPVPTTIASRSGSSR
jgi:hypothetical protein